MPKPPEPRKTAEIQRAHDVLHFLGLPEAPGVFADPTAIHVAHDALDFAPSRCLARSIAGLVRAGGYQARIRRLPPS